MVDPGVPDKRLLGHAPGIHVTLAQGAREGNTLGPTLRVAWDGKRLLNALRDSGKGAEECREPHVSVVAHITHQELRATLTSVEGERPRKQVFARPRAPCEATAGWRRLSPAGGVGAVL